MLCFPLSRLTKHHVSVLRDLQAIAYDIKII